VECSEFLDQPVLELARPFAPQERDDLGAAMEELGAVAPAAVLGIGAGDPSGSRVFQASSAMRTFWIAVASVNGGSGGRAISVPSAVCSGSRPNT
jgi:hypothetical protein